MIVQDRLYSDSSDKVLYKVLLSGPELSLFSSISEDIGDAAIATAGTAGVGALTGKAVKSIKKRGLRGLITKRALQGAGVGTIGDTLGTITNLKDIEKVAGRPNRGLFVLENSAIGGTAGGSLGALGGAVEKYLRKKELKKLTRKGAKLGAIVGGTGYLVHRISKKKDGNRR